MTGIEALGSVEPGSLRERMARDYLHRLKEQFGADFVALLTLYNSKSSAPDPLAALLDDPAFRDSIESMAKQVVNVWLLSQYRVETSDKKGEAAPVFDAGYFELGFIWPAIKGSQKAWQGYIQTQLTLQFGLTEWELRTAEASPNTARFFL